MDYNQTLNLPKTEFPMRAGLPTREGEFLARWEANDQYRKLMKVNEGKPLFVLHDGPPYANGDIHIGHALNKTLKDFIVSHRLFRDGILTACRPNLLQEKRQESVRKAISLILNSEKSAVILHLDMLIFRESLLKDSELLQSGINLILLLIKNLKKNR